MPIFNITIYNVLTKKEAPGVLSSTHTAKTTTADDRSLVVKDETEQVN